MEKKKIEIIVTSIGIVILIFIVVPKKSHPPSPVKAGKEDRLRRMSAEVLTKADKSQTLKKAITAQKWGRDPFIFGETKTAETGGLSLNGILWDEIAPSAIINNTVVKIGDEVDGNRVVDIQKERVILSKEGSTYELNLATRPGE